MKIEMRWLLPVVLAVSRGLPAATLAQGKGHAKGHDRGNAGDRPRVVVVDRDDRRDPRRDDDRRDDRRDSDRRDDRWRNDHPDRRDVIVLRDRSRTIVLDRDDFAWYPVRSPGPAFCRSGAGHPVWGLQWCLARGYAIGRPGSWFLWGDDLFLLDQGRVIVLRDRGYDADRAFWGAAVSQILAWVD